MNEGLLIVGADGLLGNALQQHWRAKDQSVIGTSRHQSVTANILPFDMATPPRKWPDFSGCRIAVLCAAVTGLEECRRNPAATQHINVTQTIALAERLAEQKTFVVFLSTNLVFDGTKPLRKPDELVCPMTEYGRQKAAAERELSRLGDRCAIVRLTKVVHDQLSLMGGWMGQLKLGQSIAPFSDFFCAPIPLAATVRAIAAVAERELGGVWQLSASTDISYADIARRLAELNDLDSGLVRPVSASGRADWEHVPRHTTLDATKSAGALGFQIRPPLETIDEVFPHELLNS